MYSIYNLYVNPNDNLNSLNFNSNSQPTQNNNLNSNGVKISRVGTTKFSTNVSKKNNKPFLWGILGVVIAFVVIGGFLFTVFNRKGGQLISPLADKKGGVVDNRTVMNPLTGKMYTEEDSVSWKGKRPIGVMINNHVDARPQWGISDADIVYEIVAEGGITRYLAFFLTDLPQRLGPVRSTREYYLVLVKELGDAAIMHIGWSPQALEAIETWPVRSLARGGATFDRDQSRIDSGIAIEHTAYVGGSYLRELSDSLGWEGVNEFNVWKFKEDKPITAKVDGADNCSAVGLCKNIVVDFWYQGDYTALFKYNPENNSYLKFTGYDTSNNPVPVIDDNNKKQVEVKNVIVQFVPEVSIEGDEKNRLEYQLVGSGEGLVFMDGNVVPITWSKSERDVRTMFFDQEGNEIQFNRGKFWISIVPDRNKEQVLY